MYNPLMASLAVPGMNQQKPLERLLNTKEVGRIIGVSAETVKLWRKKQIGPGYLRHMGRVRYRSSVIAEYVNRLQGSKNTP